MPQDDARHSCQRLILLREMMQAYTISRVERDTLRLPMPLMMFSPLYFDGVR